jgi:hypothetical protein
MFCRKTRKLLIASFLQLPQKNIKNKPVKVEHLLNIHEVKILITYTNKTHMSQHGMTYDRVSKRKQ